MIRGGVILVQIWKSAIRNLWTLPNKIRSDLKLSPKNWWSGCRGLDNKTSFENMKTSYMNLQVLHIAQLLFNSWMENEGRGWNWKHIEKRVARHIWTMGVCSPIGNSATGFENVRYAWKRSRVLPASYVGPEQKEGLISISVAPYTVSPIAQWLP